jgi:tetratricopeptide (TPR) repeat protein
MRLRIAIVPLVLAGLFTAGPPTRAEPGSSAEMPRKARGVVRPNRNSLDFLFQALKAAPDATIAKAVEDRIWAIWLHSKSDTCNLLMTRVKGAVDGQDLDLALELLGKIIEINPNYTEAWNRRATIYYMQKDFGRAMADLRQVLTREPRHFGAMSGLGMILQDVGDEKHALDVYRRALAIHPYLPRIPDLIKTLTEKVEGRDI